MEPSSTDNPPPPNEPPPPSQSPSPQSSDPSSNNNPPPSNEPSPPPPSQSPSHPSSDPSSSRPSSDPSSSNPSSDPSSSHGRTPLPLNSPSPQHSECSSSAPPPYMGPSSSHATPLPSLHPSPQTMEQTSSSHRLPQFRAPAPLPPQNMGPSSSRARPPSFLAQNSEASSTQQPQVVHDFLAQATGITEFSSTSKDTYPGPNQNLNPDNNPNLNPNLNPDQNSTLHRNPNPDQNLYQDPYLLVPNPHLNPNHNPNINPDHNPSFNPAQNPNPNQNPRPTLNPNTIQGMKRDRMSFLGLSYNPPQNSNQPKTNPTMVSRLPPPPPRRVPSAVEKLIRNCEQIQSTVESLESAVVPDDATFPGATEVVFKEPKKPQPSGGTSIGDQSTHFGSQMTILYGNQAQVVENVHPNKVRQIISYAQAPPQSVQPSQASSSTNLHANSSQLLANYAPIRGTELRLNFGSSEVTNVEETPARTTVNESDAQPSQTASDNNQNEDPQVQPMQTDNDQNVDQIVQPLQNDIGNSQNVNPPQTDTDNDQNDCW